MQARSTRLRFADAAARWIFGLFYLATGVWVAIATATRQGGPKQPTPRAAAFTDALTATGFMDPLLAVAYLLGGAALLSRRTAPAGIVILAPTVIVIFFFHWCLSGQYIWGTINMAWLGVLAWLHRERLLGLVRSPLPHRTNQEPR